MSITMSLNTSCITPIAMRQYTAFVSSFPGISPALHLRHVPPPSRPSNCTSTHPYMSSSSTSTSTSTSPTTPAPIAIPSTVTTRRSFLTILSLLPIATTPIPFASFAADDEFSLYKGPVSLGYSFSYPSSWSVKKKPIKTHLSEIIVTDNVDPSCTAGLVVDAVKITSIEEIGSPQTVGEKVIALETKKDSVNNAFITNTNAVKKDTLTYYIIDYTVDSTRGVKRYVAKATVTGGQLYVFTAQAKVDNFSGDTEQKLQQMLTSFNVVKQYL